MPLLVTFAAEPSDLQGPTVVLMMLLGNRITADGARLGGDLATALIHVGVRAGDRSLLLARFEVRVPRTTGLGVRSMAHAAIPLGQAIIGLATFRARCFHGTNCISTAKNFWAKSRFFGRGWFSWNKKTVSRTIDRVKPGQGRRSLGSGPFFGPRAPVGGPGAAVRGPGAGRRAPRPPGRRPGRLVAWHQVRGLVDQVFACTCKHGHQVDTNTNTATATSCSTRCKTARHQLQHQVDQVRDTWRADHGPGSQGSRPGTAGGRPGGLMGLDQVGRLQLDQVGRLQLDQVGRLQLDQVGRLQLDQVGRLQLDQVGRPGRRYPKRKTRRAAGFAVG